MDTNKRVMVNHLNYDILGIHYISMVAVNQ